MDWFIYDRDFRQERISNQCSRHIENSQMIHIANQLNGFYMMKALFAYGLSSVSIITVPLRNLRNFP